jgi:DNA-binding NarL/FixJ family response regulator
MEEENEKPRFLTVEGFALERASLKAILSATYTHSTIKEAANFEEVRQQLDLNPAFSLLIFSLASIEPPELRMLQQIMSLPDHPQVLVIGPDKRVDEIMQVIRLGIRGYITKKQGHHELINAVQKLLKGEKYFPEPAQQVMSETKNVGGADYPNISTREKQILSLVVQGYNNVSIAEQLYISTRTVENHRANMMRKLNVKNAAELVKKAIEERIV